MSKNKSKKVSIYLYIILTIAGCVFACSSIIPNDYLKLVVVMGFLGIGIFGILKGLSQPESTDELPTAGQDPTQAQ